MNKKKLNDLIKKNFLQSFFVIKQLFEKQTKIYYISYMKNSLLENSFFTKFIKSRIHLGHKTLKLSLLRPAWHSLMSSYLIGKRNENCILTLDYTLRCLLKAFFVLVTVLKSEGCVLFVNTNPEFSGLIKQSKKFLLNYSLNNKFLSTEKKILYCEEKWVGGLLTNWNSIVSCVERFSKFTNKFDNYIVKNNINLPRYKKWKTQFKGLINETNNFTSFSLKTKKPNLLFVFNPNNNSNLLKEALKLHIPVIALTDSNTDLSYITYPIPANDQSLFFYWYCLNSIIKIILVDAKNAKKDNLKKH